MKGILGQSMFSVGLVFLILIIRDHGPWYYLVLSLFILGFGLDLWIESAVQTTNNDKEF